MAQVTWGTALSAKVTFRNTTTQGVGGSMIPYTWTVRGIWRTNPNSWADLFIPFVNPVDVSVLSEKSVNAGANEVVLILLSWPAGFTKYPGKSVDLYVSLYDQNGKEYDTNGVEGILVIGTPTLAPKFELVSIEVS